MQYFEWLLYQSKNGIKIDGVHMTAKIAHSTWKLEEFFNYNTISRKKT